MLKQMLFIFLGGGLGSVLRYAIGLTYNTTLPYGTLLANLIGCLCIGLVMGYYEKQIMQHHHFLLLAVGFCGGFTTFSSFAVENLKLLQNQAYTQFLLYLLLSIVVGIFAVYVGFRITKVSV